MMNLQVSIENWAMWARGVPAIVAKNSASESIAIPANLKRRCGNLSKVAFEIANKTIGSQPVDYAVFCSQHGELECAVDLLKDISRKNPVSPAKFSQSVHNNVAGLFCIHHHLHINTISIAARSNTFLMGVFESMVWLKLNPGKTVLLVVSDGFIPEEFKVFSGIDSDEYAVALLLTDRLITPPVISFALKENLEKGLSRKDSLALEFIKWYTEPMSKELNQKTDDYLVKWCKNNVNT